MRNILIAVVFILSQGELVLASQIFSCDDLGAGVEAVDGSLDGKLEFKKVNEDAYLGKEHAKAEGPPRAHYALKLKEMQEAKLKESSDDWVDVSSFFKGVDHVERLHFFSGLILSFSTLPRYVRSFSGANFGNVEGKFYTGQYTYEPAFYSEAALKYGRPPKPDPVYKIRDHVVWNLGIHGHGHSVVGVYMKKSDFMTIKNRVPNRFTNR